MIENTTITAIATGEGGAIAIIRVSGEHAISICDSIFSSPTSKTLESQRGFSLLYGYIVDGERQIDDVLISVFRAPQSYTGENMVEISCHGSGYIKHEIMRLLIDNGAQSARAGEFTLRAFLNGKLDLAQAEAVADLIASENRESHSLAINQMRGNYSNEFLVLRDSLLKLSSLLELELDFGEEDVEFADRTQLNDLINHISDRLNALKKSFALGNVIKNGIPVAIVGSPNVGKSTLLNALLQEERAMVSDIAGTTRDVIEDVININGIQFRFIDTAGIRKTSDILESMGIERTFKRIENASVILFVADASSDFTELQREISGLSISPNQTLIIVLNKCDKLTANESIKPIAIVPDFEKYPVFAISAKSGLGVVDLTNYLSGIVNRGVLEAGDVIVTNARHYESLERAVESLSRAQNGLQQGITGDLLSQDIREVLYNLGIITGEITTDDILSSIFSKFCIGK